MLIANERGNYSFLKGIAPYSAGAIASAGHQIVRARFRKEVALRAGFDAVDQHLKAVGRPRQALCGMELRSPRPFTFQGFADFNAGYVDVLKTWNILQDGLNPVARTNVAPELDPPREPLLYGFSYTVPSKEAGHTFVVAGAGELPEGSLDPHDVVRRGETSPAAIAEKCRFVMGLMTGRLQGLGVEWAEVTCTDVFTVHPIHALLEREILKPMTGAARHGIVWHYTRPPIISIEYEMDLHGSRSEVVL
ncbi:MAG: hypothetical protein ABIZ80_15740 [Bryobacteraceae bacterium]